MHAFTPSSHSLSSALNPVRDHDRRLSACMLVPCVLSRTKCCWNDGVLTLAPRRRIQHRQRAPVIRRQERTHVCAPWRRDFGLGTYLFVILRVPLCCHPSELAAGF